MTRKIYDECILSSKDEIKNAVNLRCMCSDEISNKIIRIIRKDITKLLIEKKLNDETREFLEEYFLISKRNIKDFKEIGWIY